MITYSSLIPNIYTKSISLTPPVILHCSQVDQLALAFFFFLCAMLKFVRTNILQFP